MGHAGVEDDGRATLEHEVPLQTTKMAAKKEANPKFFGDSSLGPRHERQTLVWRNVVLFIILHILALCGLVTVWRCKWQTIVFTVYLFYVGGIGITAGVHRLWAHRSYKAKWPLRLWLMLHNTMSLQNDIYEWSRDHRAHHKFSDTDGDPHNVSRGFFFAHMGWLLVKKHPEVFRKGQQIDMSDLEADPIVTFQRSYKPACRVFPPALILFHVISVTTLTLILFIFTRRYYKVMAPFFCFVLPTIIPWYFWNENIWYAYFVTATLRYTLQLHCFILANTLGAVTWLVNSAAHMWGMRPFDKFINPAENIIVTKLSLGEGWHNYHHAFPYDYRASELGWKHNTAGMFIDASAWLGLAYDRKTAAPETVEARMKRTGDGTRLEARGHY